MIDHLIFSIIARKLLPTVVSQAIPNSPHLNQASQQVYVFFSISIFFYFNIECPVICNGIIVIQKVQAVSVHDLPCISVIFSLHPLAKRNT